MVDTKKHKMLSSRYANTNQLRSDDLEESGSSGTEGKSNGTTDLGTSALVGGGAGSGASSRGLVGSPRGSEASAGRTTDDTAGARGHGST
jgi:hypothetical protein